jgi:hypothetical protein
MTKNTTKRTPTMEMHDLQQAWKSIDARLEQQAMALRDLRHGSAIDAVRGRLRGAFTWLLLQLLAGLLLVLWAGGYWVGHLGEVHLAIYGIALHLYGLALLVTALLQLVGLQRLDYRVPVLQVQRRLLALRRLRMRCEQGLALAGAVIWLPALLVVMNAIGIDLWQSRPSVVIANLVVAACMALLAGWAMRRFRDAFERDASGRHLRDAEADLAELVDVPCAEAPPHRNT